MEMGKFQSTWCSLVLLMLTCLVSQGQNKIDKKSEKSQADSLEINLGEANKKPGTGKDTLEYYSVTVESFKGDKPKHESVEAQMHSGPFTQLDNEALQIVFKGKKYTVVIVNPEKVELQMFLPKKKGVPGDIGELVSAFAKVPKRIRMAMNAGMFEPSFRPLGLYINNGKEEYPINIDRGKSGNFFAYPPNAVFAVDSNNMAYVIESEKFEKLASKVKIKLATQSGPMMVIDGKFNNAFNKGSSNLNVRNGVGVTENNRVVFVISDDPVNFYEFSQLMRDVLSCNNSLYLDGAVSHMYLPEFKKTSSNRAPLGPIIVITK
jgi:uncharacterized protein YigE (DUF2233 family)